MPKKYKQKSLLTKPTSSAPSNLSLSKASGSQNVPATKTVNDLIRESRRENGNERPQPVSTASSVPPSVRAVLDLPAPSPPTPRLGVRGPTRLRRIPGPPPPRSWLADSVHAPAKVRDVPWSKANQRTRVQKQSSTLPEGGFPSDRSLQHVVMKNTAVNWQWHAQYDHEYLSELPTTLKQTLLSYLAIYSDGQGPNPLRLLFPASLSQEERDEVRRLDLGNAVGGWSTIKKIEKELYGENYGATNKQSVPSVGDEVPDAWDDNNVVNVSPKSGLTLGGMRFRNLKHLSLAVTPGTPGPTASWSGLLAVANKLSTLTSLSLAYWPRPTYTPNASTSMVKIGATSSRPSALTYGGTNFYSDFDNDWREAAGILRSLSRALYCLNWLDLTGCSDWFSALTWQPSGGQDEDMSTITGPDWNGSWRGLQHLILAIGWSPGLPPNEDSFELLESTDTSATEVFGEDDPSEDLASQWASTRLADRHRDFKTEKWNVEFERAKYYYKQEVAQHTAAENLAKKVAQEARTLRKAHGGKWIDIDFGHSDDT